MLDDLVLCLRFWAGFVLHDDTYASSVWQEAESRP